MLNFDPAAYPIGESVIAWLKVVGGLSLIVLVVGLLTQLLTAGLSGVAAFLGGIGAFFSDLFELSLRRVFAIGRLTILEAIRRKAFLVFAIFAVIFMFGGWFLTGSQQAPDLQVKVYVVFVVMVITRLSLPVILILSCFGIPEDIRLRSIHTVVTKPVRRLEIVLGRMLGYSLVSIAFVSVMSIVGYLWLLRQVPEEAQSSLTCRQPLYGNLTFLDRVGQPAEGGINVGDIWAFRSYIEGGTKARAVWTFPNVTEEAFVRDGDAEFLRLESRFQAFRSHKGQMDRSLYFQYWFVNPDNDLRIPSQIYEVAEFRGRSDDIPRQLVPLGGTGGDESKKVYDLLTDLRAKDGSLRVELMCIDPQQYLGMARPDLFIRQPDLPFAVGYFKCIIGVIMMQLLVVILAVTASTFLKGPICTFIVAGFLFIAGYFREFMDKLLSAKWEGGGTLESIYRLVFHLNPSVELPVGPATTLMKGIDQTLNSFLWLVRQILPNFEYYGNMPNFVAAGLDVDFAAAVVPAILIPLAYFVPCVLLAYYSLRLRELEAK